MQILLRCGSVVSIHCSGKTEYPSHPMKEQRDPFEAEFSTQMSNATKSTTMHDFYRPCASACSNKAISTPRERIWSTS